MKRLVLLLTMGALLSAGCATYGFIDSTGDDDARPTLRVETVAAPAHLGLDHSQLRSLLIDELELSGVQVVDSSSTHELMCTVVDHRSTGFERSLVAEIDMACDIRGPGASPGFNTFKATGLSTEQLDDTTSLPRAALKGTRRADLTAAVDAFSRLAPEIAEAVEQLHDSPDFDSDH